VRVVKCGVADGGPIRPRRRAVEDPFLAEVLKLLPQARAFAMALTGCPERADDLLHDSLVKVIRFRGGFQPGTNLRAWLYSIVRNSFLTEAKRRARMLEDPDGLFSARLASAPPQEWRVRHRELIGALQKLPAEHRSLLILAAGGSSYEEAAEICGCPIGTVKSRLSRARRRLQRLLDPDGDGFVGPSDWLGNLA
jgi:RNA polymerase sigma-70 factor (ECF subfamily)